MKLRRLFAALLAFALIIDVSPLNAIRAAAEDTVVSAIDTNYVLYSAAVKHTQGASFLERGTTTGLYEDDPTIGTLLELAPGEFNASGAEWPWMAYKVSVPAEGTYTLGVTTNSCKWANFKLPMVVNRQVYTLTYTAKAQNQTAQVTLPAGEHIVTVFWPMPANESEVYVDADWNSYLWANIASVTVDPALTVSAAPTAAEVEASIEPAVQEDAVISALDTEKLLLSATIKQNATALGRPSASQLAEKVDQPTIETLFIDASGEFNKPGEEWNWFAYKVTASAEGTYSLSVKVNNCKFASYKLPVCVNGQVYTLQYTAKNQEVAAEVTLSAGEHVVVVFMPMPATKADITNNEYNDYHWCDVESVTVDGELTVSKPTAAEVEAVFAPAVYSATDTELILWSAAVKYTQGAAFVERGDTTGLYEDDPRIDTLLTAAPGQFNDSGKEWPWIAYKLSVPVDGTYTLGVTTNSCKWANFKLPMVVNGEVHTLTFTAKAQTLTAEVTLPAGEHIVTVFWPMPANESEVYPEDWNNYLWCNIASVVATRGLTVSKPTAAEVEDSFPETAESSPLYEKSALFVGDSITHSANSWASVIGTAYAMDWTNGGVNGATISDVKDRIIRHQMMANAGKNYDYVIMHGGINDAMAEVAIGTVCDSFNVADFDKSTYLGGLETLFCYAYESFPGAKLGYIINYATPNSKFGGYTANEDTKAYYEAAKAVCEKWGVPYIDLYSGSTADGKSYSFDILQVDNAAENFINNDAQEIHLSAAGYELISPYIAQWMESLTANENPIPADNSGKHIDATDGDKVLFSNFTAKNEYKDGVAVAGLQDRVYTGMAEDNATIELLPYAKDMLGDWAFASIAVDAAEDGDYTIQVEMAAKVQYQMGMLVDGQVYTLEYSKQNGHYQFMEQTVTLTKGTHYITFTAAMPGSESQLEGDAWNIYPWTNIASVIVDEGLQVLSKPSLEDVTAKLSSPEVEPEDPVMISAVDTDRILLSATIKQNETTLGRTDQETLNLDQPTIESLYDDAYGRFGQWNWFAYKVTVSADGTYTLGVKTAGSKVASYQLPLCVNGELYALQYTEKAQLVTAEVTLPAGEHTVVMFMPLPAVNADLTGNAWNDYHWCDVESVAVDAQLAVSKPTLAEVEACFPAVYTRVEAENTEYVLHNNYNTPDESNTAASGGMVVGGAWNSTYKQTFEQLEKWLNFKGNAYVEYAVVAPADGEYDIRVGFLAGSNDKTIEKPYIAVAVNDTAYKAQFTKNWNQIDKVKLTVSLKEGLNIIRCTSMTTEQPIYSARGWINQDFLDVDSSLTPVKRSSPVTVEAENSKYFNKFKVQEGAETEAASGKVLGSAERSYITANKLTLDQLTQSVLKQIPYFSLTVTAPQNGYYPIRVAMAGDGRLPQSTVGMLVDGQLQAVEYSRTDKTTKGAMLETLVYLTAGDHVIVFTTPMPAVADEEANYSYFWSNYDYVMLYDGLTLAENQKAPTAESGSVTISALNTNNILLSATVKQNANALGRTDQETMMLDQPTINTLYHDAYGKFNAPDSPWNWFAYEIEVPEDGTYTLGVKTAGSKVDNYKIPLCVNGQVYALQYTEKAQEVTVQVTLPAGKHVVVVFMPMPETKGDITGNAWNDYHWCDVESVTVDARLTVSKPTTQEVEACFPDPVAEGPLKEKSVLFVGDSITHSKASWASVIGTAYRMDWTNGGVNGATVSDVKDRIIRHQLMAYAGNDYDYVIMHGGINDAMAEVTIGKVSDSFNVADFDKNTYIGGLETLFYYAYETFSGAKLGYIINYATPNSKFGGFTAGADTKAYYEEAKKVCEKWGIPYIDLYSGSTADGKSYSFDILQVDKAAENFINNDAQEIHLSAAGYELICPYIAKWMESLTAKESPIPAATSGKHINANDGDKVLFANFTAKSEYKDGVAVVGLQDRVYTGMAEDQATVELLPYAKDMLGDWAFASVAVDAAEAGEYTIQVEMAAKTQTQMGMLVDGKVYTLEYSKQDGHYQFMEQTVSLSKGKHYITFTAAMPNNDNALEGNLWDLYPWTNIASVVVDKGLKVLEAPNLQDVTSKLETYTPAYTRVEAENTEYVLYNNYNTPDESNTAASGGMVVGGAWNSTYKQTFEQLEKWMSFKGNAYVEYAVVAPEDGEYDIRVGFLAGSNDKTIEKPYIAVIVNDTTYKAQFTKNWNQIDKVKLTVSLKEGLNIIRCTSMTTEQGIYGVRGWINHDFLDVDTRLTPVKRSAPVIAEAEDSKYFNRFKVQAGAETEAASGDVLGGTDRKYVSGLKLTLDQLTQTNLVQVPYVSFTVTAPQNGYYPIRVAMAGDGRLSQSTVGMMVDGQLQAVPYSRTDKTTKGAMLETLVYLTAGDHVITFTSPMPATADPAANYSYHWCNYDYVMLYDGLTLADHQKAPTAEAEYARVEVEEYAMFNLNKNNGTAAGNANYKVSQSIAEILESGIDGSKTPYVELTVQASKAGSYVLYVGISVGMTAGSTVDALDTQLAVEVNGKLSTESVRAAKSTSYTILPLQVELAEGKNIIRLTHLSSDAQRGGTTWIDFDYIEMPAWASQQLTFVKSGEVLEAETARYDGFGESLSNSYSGGRYLGRVNYDTVAEVNITYDNMDPANLNGIPYVTYKVFAEKAGTYALTVGFAAGLTNYTPEEIQQGVKASFVAIVNGQTKQRVEFMLGSTSANMTRLILVDLKEGENEVTVTGTTTEYVIDRVPRNDETYRLVWIDQDYLQLSGELSNMGQDVDPFDVEDSSYDFSQLVPRTPSETPQPDDDTTAQPDFSAIVWILAGVGAVTVLLVIILIIKKRKKNKE